MGSRDLDRWAFVGQHSSYCSADSDHYVLATRDRAIHTKGQVIYIASQVFVVCRIADMKDVGPIDEHWWLTYMHPTEIEPESIQSFEELYG